MNKKILLIIVTLCCNQIYSSDTSELPTPAYFFQKFRTFFSQVRENQKIFEQDPRAYPRFIPATEKTIKTLTELLATTGTKCTTSQEKEELATLFDELKQIADTQIDLIRSHQKPSNLQRAHSVRVRPTQTRPEIPQRAVSFREENTTSHSSIN